MRANPRDFVSIVVLGTLACGPGTPSGDDDVGETSGDASSSGESGSSETETSDESESGEPETESETESETDTQSESETTDTGERVPVCMLEPGETLWSLPCDACSHIVTPAGLISLTLEGSQIPDDVMICGHFQFEGTVMDHPSPDVWVFDACPCDQDCNQPDPHTLDLSGEAWPDPGPHPAPELLPTELGQCVRVDVWKSGSLGGIEALCRPQAVALWNLDGDAPVLSYAQGGSSDYEFPISLGELEIDAQDDCELADAGGVLHTWSYMFMLAGVSVVVPSQTSGTVMTASGEWQALNLAAQDWSSNIDSESTTYHWWAVHPAI